MTTKHFNLVILALLALSACKSPPSYVPTPEQVKYSTRGGYIKVKHVDNNIDQIKGELIAVGEKEIYILSNDYPDTELVSINISDIRYYKLKLAYTNRFNWAPPVLGLMSIFHGIRLVYTLPINLITTTFIANNTNFSYGEKHIPVYRLYQYARFPQGIPESLDKEMIR